VTPGSETSRPIRVVPRRPAIDKPLLAYGLVTGILAVSAGVIVSSQFDRWGGMRQPVSIITALVVASLAIIFASRILGWVLSASVSPQAQNADNGRGNCQH
jgi:hypothetical protein